METKRNTQLDGWRAFAVLGVMWVHWAPRAWRGSLPFEIGLYFFLTLTGFFVTRLILREQMTDRAGVFARFIRRRALRILVPCFAAFGFAWLVGAPDLRAHPWWYVCQLANFHIAHLPEWPSGTSHYWTLAIQSQIYLLWPIVLLVLPRKALPAACLITTAAAPASRAILLHHFPEISQPGAITTCTLDYLGLGGLLALGFSAGMKADDRRLRFGAWFAAVIWAVLYVFDESGRPLPMVRHFQQTFLTVAMCGLISASMAGLPGWISGILEHRFTQHFAKISYSLYLFHSLIPLALGFLLPFLWGLPEGHAAEALRILGFFLGSWGIAWLSWRWIEQPVDRWRNRAS